MFIYGKEALIAHLLKLFNIFFSIWILSRGLVRGICYTAAQKCSINDENNYRGITLLSVLGKLFTRVINNRSSDWAESYGVHIEAQTGFRSNLGTSDNIYVLHGLINHFINNNKQFYCAFIAFSKAFDYVNRDNL